MRTSKNPELLRPTPARTCVACRQVKGKREMVRLVRTADGGVEIDMTGKMNGRGAYLCRTSACWDKALKGNHLERHLRTGLTDDNRSRLAEQRKEILGETGSGEGQ